MLKFLQVVLVGLIVTGCANTAKDVKTFQGSMPYVEGTPTLEQLKSIPDLDAQNTGVLKGYPPVPTPGP